MKCNCGGELVHKGNEGNTWIYQCKVCVKIQEINMSCCFECMFLRDCECTPEDCVYPLRILSNY